MNKLELSDQKYQKNGNVRDEKYKGKLLFPIKDFVLISTDLQSMHFMSTRWIKDNINGFYVTKFQLDYICDTTHPANKNLVKLCC